jgi:protein gp37
VSTNTVISWTQATWNPVVGCEHVSEGCDNCYAKTLHDMRHRARLAGKRVLPLYDQPFEVVQLRPHKLTEPLRWRAPKRVFVNSMSDLFHKDVPLDFLDKCFAVMAFARRHTFQILTKRPHRMAAYMNAWANIHVDERLQDRWDAARRWLREVVPADMTPMRLPNVWLGTSVEHQAAADVRIPHLLNTPAAVRFLSCEPLLGPVALRGLIGHGTLQWIIVGGESGPKRRELDLDWLRAIVDDARYLRAAPFVKQDSALKSEQRGRIPDDLWIREYPAA